jgi:tetratricopeptide (TPR) repeat protein
MSVTNAQAERDLIVAREFHFHEAASAPLGRSLHQLPSLPAIFTGRDDELAELEKKLISVDADGDPISGKHAGLQGMGGVGKTALAIVLAHRLADRYPDAQLFLNLRGADPGSRAPVTPVEAMQNVIHCFRPEERLPDTLDALTPAYCSVLAEAGRVLLLLDNAVDAAQVRPLLPPPNCLLLVTSRAQFSLPGLAIRNVDCLPPTKSQELLVKLSERFDGHAKEAAELCGHLPLALEVFAGAVNDKKLYPLPELLERLRARQDKLAPVEAAFQVSYELLSAELRRRWTLLAVFPLSFDLRAAAAVWSGQRSLELDSTREFMQALLNASLVEWNETTDRFRLHDLVRQFCDGQLSAGDRAVAQLRHARHYCGVASESQDLYRQGGEKVLDGLELFDRERAHLEAAFAFLAGEVGRNISIALPERGSLSRSMSEHVQPHEVAEDQRPALQDFAALIVLLVDAVVYISPLRFQPRQRIQWHEEQRDAARLAGNRRGEGNALGNLGIVYLTLGDARKAIEFHEQDLAIAHEIGNRWGEGSALSNLGNAYYSLGDARKAIEFYEQSLVIDREVGDRRGEGNSLGNLGNAYSSLGNARKAIEFYEQALVVRREIGNRLGEGTDLGNLGNAYFSLGDVRKAIEFHEQALIIRREIGHRLGEGNALGNLGNAYKSLGDAHKAIEFHEQALIICREIGDRLGESNVLDNLGSAYSSLGDARKAAEFHEQALFIAREIGSRREEGNALGNLGNVYCSLGDVRKAIEFHEQALIICREIGDRLGEGSVLGNLGGAYYSLGDARKAIKFYEDGLVVAREVGDRRGEGNALGNLGGAYKKLGDAGKAIEFSEQALVIGRETGDQSGEGNALIVAALALDQLGGRAEAITRMESALRIFEAIEHPKAVPVRAKLAQWREKP